MAQHNVARHEWTNGRLVATFWRDIEREAEAPVIGLLLRMSDEPEVVHEYTMPPQMALAIIEGLSSAMLCAMLDMRTDRADGENPNSEAT